MSEPCWHGYRWLWEEKIPKQDRTTVWWGREWCWDWHCHQQHWWSLNVRTSGGSWRLAQIFTQRKGVKKKEAHFICHMFSCHPADSIKAPKETQVLSRKHNTNPVNNLASVFLHLAPNSWWKGLCFLYGRLSDSTTTIGSYTFSSSFLCNIP